MPDHTQFNRRNLMRILAGAAAVAPTVPALFSAPAWAPADKKKTGMIVRSTRPEDLEMMIDGFRSDITPIERFFVRSHHYTPKVDLATWKLKVGGHVATPVEITFEQIQKMPKVELVSVLECAGNGRSFYEPSMPGLQWEHGAVGNARWGGVKLSEVLKLAGVQDGAVEVMFDGADTPVGTQPDFQRCIPIGKARSDGPILAYEMNGEPLPTSHGFPLRLVVPGWAGDCWVKWVTGITVLNKPFEGFYMKTAYRHPGKAVHPGTAVDPSQMEPVTRLRPKGVITYPEHGSQLEVGKPVNVTAVVWSGDGYPVTVGKVSVDGGSSWEDVRPGMWNGPYSWRTVTFSYTPGEECYQRIMLRVGDQSGEVQPHVPAWNPSGYNWNVSHWVGVDVVKEIKPVAPGSPAPEPGITAPAAFRQNCLVCHADDVIKQQRLTRGQWEREVDKMIRWGAKVKDTDRSALLDYLSKAYPPRPAK